MRLACGLKARDRRNDVAPGAYTSAYKRCTRSSGLEIRFMCGQLVQ